MKLKKIILSLLIAGAIALSTSGCKGDDAPLALVNDVNVPACQADADCDADQVCKDGACVKKEEPAPTPECEKDADCSSGEVCQSNKCAAVPAPSDTTAPTIKSVTPLSIPHVSVDPGSFPPQIVTTYEYTMAIFFSEPMDPKSLTIKVYDTVAKKDDATAKINLSADGVTAGIQANFHEKTPYKITISGKDLAGNALTGTVGYDVTF